MPRLDERLRTVARQIRCEVHADIGSDHGHLLKALLTSGRVSKGIAVENKEQPYGNSCATLHGYNAEVRFGDGLSEILPGEVDSLSVCGMGGENVVEILSAHPRRVPNRVIVQANKANEAVRIWGLRNRMNLVDEQIAYGRRLFHVLVFERASDIEQQFNDVAYLGLPQEAALIFGPWNIRRRDPRFIAELQREQRYLGRMKRLGPVLERRLRAIDEILAI